MKLEGITRNVGMHAGGVLIAPGPLTDFTPLYVADGSDSVVSQYDKDDVEAVGLVKFDFLGLTTLTILEEADAQRACAQRQPRRRSHSIWRRCRSNDPKSFEIFTKGNTVAIFQFESKGMRDMLIRAQSGPPRRPDRAERAVSPGPDGLDSRLLRPQDRQSRVEYPTRHSNRCSSRSSARPTA